MEVKGRVTFAYGEDRNKIPKDAIEVDIFLNKEGKLFITPKENISKKKIIETSFQNETGLYIYI